MPAPKQSFFLHEALDTSVDSVRLLELLPGSDDSEIQCELFNTSFPIEEQYATLSYEWGEPTPQQIIRINGIQFCIQPNLHAFLWQIRSQLKAELPLLIWVDAICIDQYRTLERNHQVKMMRRIYSEAREVLVWLGKGGMNSTELFEVLNRQVGRHRNEDPQSKGSWPPLGMTKELLDAVFATTAWQTVVWLATRSYWKRLWVIQEIALSKRHRVFVGDCYLQSGAFAFLHLLAQHFGRRKIDLSGSPMGNILHVWLNGCRAGTDCQFELWDLLERISLKTQCSVSHDKVYGLLGIAKDGQNIEVNYNASLPELCLEIVASSTPTRNCDIQILRRFMLYLGCESFELNQEGARFLAWTDLLHRIWRNERWESFRTRKYRVYCSPITQIFDIQVDQVGGRTEFTSDTQKYNISSTEILEKDLWSCSPVGTNIVLFLSCSTPKKLELRAVAIKMNRGNPSEEESKLSLAAFRHHSHIFDKYLQQESLLSVTDVEGARYSHALVRLELIVSVLAAEPRYHPVQFCKTQSICLEQIWPTTQDRDLEGPEERRQR